MIKLYHKEPGRCGWPRPAWTCSHPKQDVRTTICGRACLLSVKLPVPKREITDSNPFEFDVISYHNAGDVPGLKSSNGQVERFLEAVVDPLTDETIEVDRPSQQLNMTLTQKRHVAVRRRSCDISSKRLALLLKPLVQQDGSGQVFVITVDLLAQLVNKLIEAEVDLCLHLIVQELLPEHGQRVVRAVIVQIQGVEDALHVGRVLGLEDMIGENPRHGHLNGKLNALSHGHFQVELAVPQLRQVATILEAL